MVDPSNPKLLVPTPDWTDSERPILPGAPSFPSHTFFERVAYGIIGVTLVICAGLGNTFVIVNLANIQGSMGLTPIEGSYLLAAYVAAFASSNFFLFKLRQQYGVIRFAEVGMAFYVVSIALHLLLSNHYGAAICVRAISGLATACLTPLSVFYLMQASGKKNAPRAIFIGLGLTQVGLPLAYVVSPLLLEDGNWHILYMFEFGLALCCLAMVFVVKLPPGVRIGVINSGDYLTAAILVPGIALSCVVLTQGRLQWWTDQRWLAVASVGAIGLLILGFAIEHHRRYPLIYTRWLSTPEMLRFAVAALTVRFVLSEQTDGTMAMLRGVAGMGPDQLVLINVIAVGGILVGLSLAAVAFTPSRMPYLVAFGAFLILVAALMDMQATSLTRPHDVMASQYCAGMAAGVITGPLLFTGIGKAFRRGGDHVLSFIIMFLLIQNVGALGSTALIGTYEQMWERSYVSDILARTGPTGPYVAQRFKQYEGAYAGTIVDNEVRKGLARQSLAQTVTREAHVRAYNDVHALIAIVSAVFLTWSLGTILITETKKRLPRYLLLASLRDEQS